jgi:hypothetical protein
MSATTAPARAPRGSAPRRPRLRVVAPPASTGGRLPFAAACIALLTLSLIGLLMLNISLSRGSYEVHALQQRAAQLAEREQELGEQLAGRAAPAQLSQQARELGMVPGTAPAFIRLSDGAVLGSPTPATEVPAPAVVVGARTVPPVIPDPVPAQSAETTAPAAPVDAAAPAGDAAVQSTQPAQPMQPAPPAPSVGDGAVLLSTGGAP